MMYGRLCDYLISTDSYVPAGICVTNRSHQHDADSQKRPTYVADMSGRHCHHVGNRHKYLSFGGCSRQTQIPTLPAKRNILTRHSIGSFILQRNPMYDVAYNMPTSVDLPSVFIIDSIQDQSVCAQQSVCTHTSN
jgi:hypothetical protein